MINLAGFARPNGITFVGPKYQVTTTLKEKKVNIVQKKVPKFLSLNYWPKKIPLLRGAWALIEMLAYMIISGSKKARLAITAWLLIGILVELWPSPEKVPNPEPNTLNYIYLFDLLHLVMIVVLAWALKVMFQFHAAEHMAINTYIADKKLSLENIRQASRISPRCGTNLVVIIFLIQIITIRILHIYIFIPLYIFLSFAIAYEIFRWQLKPFVWLGSMVQKHIVTKKPHDYQLEIASMGLETLISLEETGKFPARYTTREKPPSN